MNEVWIWLRPFGWPPKASSDMSEQRSEDGKVKKIGEATDFFRFGLCKILLFLSLSSFLRFILPMWNSSTSPIIFPLCSFRAVCHALWVSAFLQAGLKAHKLFKDVKKRQRKSEGEREEKNILGLSWKRLCAWGGREKKKKSSILRAFGTVFDEWEVYVSRCSWARDKSLYFFSVL